MLLATVLLTVPLPASAAALSQDREPLLALEHRGLEALLPDPRDAGLRTALGALLDRVDGIEHEPLLSDVFGNSMPDGLFWVLTRALHGPLHVSVSREADPIPGMSTPMVATFSAPTPDAATARELDRRLHAFMLALGAPEGPLDGDWHTVDEEPPVWWGPRDNAWELHVGARREHLPVPPPGLPQGARRALAADFDLGGFLSHTGLAGEIRLPDDFMALLTSLRLQVEIGSSADEGFVTERFVGLAAKLAEHGVVAPRALQKSDLHPIPADATWAWASTLDVAANVQFLDSLVSALTGYGEGPLREVEEELGFDPIDDLAVHLGDVCGIYASDTTGGGGLLSTVAFASVRDADALDATLDGLLARADRALRAETGAYMRTRTWEQHGARFDTLIAAGLPVPFEPTIARTGEHLLIAATPQAALAAVEELKRDRVGLTGLAGRVNFAAGLEPSAGPTSIGWIDIPALLPRGYGMATLGASALANFARADALVLPPLEELARGARPLIQVTLVDGADLVTMTRHDRSWLATMTGVAGIVGADATALGMLSLGGMASLVLPRVLVATTDAKWSKARADLSALHSALTHYYINNGSYPNDLKVLVTPDVNGNRYLNHTTVPKDPWGNEYRYDPPKGVTPPKLYTLGADGAPGGAGDGRDLSHQDVLDGRR